MTQRIKGWSLAETMTRPQACKAVRTATTGLRYQLGTKNQFFVYGKPDLINGRARCVIFVEGCDDGGHCCSAEARAAFKGRRWWRSEWFGWWIRHGYRVLVIWTCQVNETLVMRVRDFHYGEHVPL